MITRQSIKKHLIFSLTAAVLLFLAAYLLVAGVQRFNTPEKITSRFQQQLNSSYSQLGAEIENVEKLALPDSSNYFELLHDKHKNLFTGQGIEILIYSNDSLRYWSDNSFTAQSFINRDLPSGSVVKTGSGYYLVRKQQSGKRLIVAVQLLKYEYKYTNEYLPVRFHRKFSIPAYVDITLEPNRYIIRNAEGKFCCSLLFTEKFQFKGWLMYFVLAMYVASFLCLIQALFHAYSLLLGNRISRGLFFLFFVLDVLLLRFLQFYFQFPSVLYRFELFSPAYFASSSFLPSLGDLLINALLLLQLAVIFLRHAPSVSIQPKAEKPKMDFFRALLPAAVVALLVFFLTAAVRGLVLNSRISFTFDDFFSLSAVTNTGMFIISVLVLAVLFLTELAGFYFRKWIGGLRGYFAVSTLATALYALITFLLGEFDLVAVLLLAALFVLLYFSARSLHGSRLRIARLIPSILLFAALATHILNKYERIREQSERKILASHLAEARDNMAEYFYNETARSIQADKRIAARLSRSVSDSAQVMLANDIRQTYFAGFWRKYQVQVTVCTPGKKLSIKPSNIVTGCNDYFGNFINKYMQPTSVAGLYFLKQSVDSRYYLGKIEILNRADTSQSPGNIFIEISSSDIWKGLGYPELLTDRLKTNADNLSGYSYAFYRNGELVKNLGKYAYPAVWKPAWSSNDSASFFTADKYDHIIHVVDKDTTVILSRETLQFSDLISPFSYLLLLMLLLIAAIRFVTNDMMPTRVGIQTFRWRLQWIMVMVIVVSSIMLVTVSLLFINQLNRNKNNEILNEKLNSVLVDLEARYTQASSITAVPRDELSVLLLNLSNTYFTDINIFDAGGYLVASSRDQVFREGMVSEQMNAAGAARLFAHKASVFIQRENIGNYTFLSAYSPVRNIDNKLLGYLNLPYFARQEEIRKEISGLISAFANIYIIMIIITVLLALLLSNYFTRPLQQIGNQFSKVKFANQNAKINWTRKDEIGQLVGEYNRMIDELAVSAEMLARSERESAWRQMARQVAHEIKNPLTPIKLNMQLLLRAWQDKDPDWDARLKRFSQTLIMQIDTLSSIASEFSDFATMPKPDIQAFDIIPLLQQTMMLYHDQPGCELSLTTEGASCMVKADPNQMLRVFNNLIKNALQAMPPGSQGKVEISLSTRDGQCLISISDNGTGIPEELQPRIFSPNFTTKTTGMGLGLAMVKNIMDGLSGKVWFESVPGQGTTFSLSLPMALASDAATAK